MKRPLEILAPQIENEERVETTPIMNIFGGRNCVLFARNTIHPSPYFELTETSLVVMMARKVTHNLGIVLPC